MFREMCKSKLHRLKVTDADINYEGSITIDEELLQAANIKEFEKVAVVNINNGNRFQTYIIKGKKGSGEVCVNGAAARLVQIGDLVIVIAYGYVAEEELSKFSPSIVFVDNKNNIRNKSQ